MRPCMDVMRTLVNGLATSCEVCLHLAVYCAEYYCTIVLRPAKALQAAVTSCQAAAPLLCSGPWLVEHLEGRASEHSLDA